MTINKISFALFPALKKKSKFFTGGRITDIDLLTLDEAAKMATKHAGCEVSQGDFLRAAGRGEIELIAVVKKDTKFKYLDQPELTPWVVKGGTWRIPLNACKKLASTGFARWRVQEDVKVHCGNYMKYCPTLQITDDEPDLEAELSDCRVLGRHIHALADAFMQKQPQATLVPQQNSTSDNASTDSPQDSIRRLARLRGLGGSATYKHSEWKFSGISKLVKIEQTEGRKRSSEKTIRNDLKEAADSEKEAKRADHFYGLEQR